MTHFLSVEHHFSPPTPWQSSVRVCHHRLCCLNSYKKSPISNSLWFTTQVATTAWAYHIFSIWYIHRFLIFELSGFRFPAQGVNLWPVLCSKVMDLGFNDNNLVFFL